MEPSYWKELKCCNEIHRMMERKAQDQIYGEMHAKLENGILYVYAYTFSQELVTINIADFDENSFYYFKFRPFNYSEPLEEYLTNICRDAHADKLSRNKFQRYVVLALTDFLALYSQRFH